jgi:hypothetical protein
MDADVQETEKRKWDDGNGRMTAGALEGESSYFFLFPPTFSE